MFEAEAGGVVQPKLAIGAVDDPLEHEADRVADQVMRKENGPSSPFSAQGRALSRKCATCEDEEENTLQMKPAGAAAANTAPPVVHAALRNSGRPLDHATRAFMEPRFARDFSHVRVHTDALASRSAEAVAARAYTVGPNIVFRSGEYEPDTAAGRSLLAHELAHVVQQGGAQPATLRRVHVDAAGRKQFDSPDFAGDPKLEACLNDEDRLRPGARGESVAKVQRGLLKDGANLGPTGADGIFGHLTETALRDFKKKYDLKTTSSAKWGSQQFVGDVGPKTMEKLDALGTSPGPSPAPTPPSPEPTQPRVCGPNVDSQLTAVLGDIETFFTGLSFPEQYIACNTIGFPVTAAMAWDIHQLFLKETDWLRYPPFLNTCGIPWTLGEVEWPGGCSNTVRAGGKCNLAGTVNYSMLGMIIRLCGRYTPKALGRANITALVYAWKAVERAVTGHWDDPTPAIEFAHAVYMGGASARPATENRPTCTGSCPHTNVPSFTFRWRPFHEGD
ncbi:eCIS core domain-containing protein [Mycolicibacterium iranicum]|uniref:Uncharacterized protein n=1 Tax=Mycolicibacterium iranicum TaxID=912594 RepID=A0A178LS16_MYCIR|nr:DUF4157 domain-containing protein [Mycolicibacterium iranicum]OAN36770.1 hypothetical protein A4X20_06130 [Mycolicibacterium iranicum]